MKILVAGLSSIGQKSIQPAVDIVNSLPLILRDAFIIKHTIPASVEPGFSVFSKLIDEQRPSAVICVSQAGGRHGLSVEFAALNFCEDSQARGVTGLTGRAIVADGPAACFSTLPLRDITAAARIFGVPAEVSYLVSPSPANELMYRVLHHIACAELPVAAGLIQIPYLPAQTVALEAPAPCLSAADIKSGLEIAISAAIESLKGRNKN